MTEHSAQTPGEPRRVLLLAHTGRDDAREVARAFRKALTAHGIVVRLLAQEAEDLVGPDFRSRGERHFKSFTR